MQAMSILDGLGLARAVREQPDWAAGAAAAMLVCGILALLSPMVLGAAAMVAVGILLIIGGAGQCVWATKTESRDKGWLVFSLGAIAVLTGCYLVFQPITALSPVITAVAVYLGLTGVGTVVHALSLRANDGWLWMLAAGAASMLLALLVVSQWPAGGVWAVGFWIGLQLILCGVSLIRLVVTRDYARKLAELDD